MTTKQTLPREAEEFLDSLIARSPATKRLYRFVLTHFFECTRKEPKALDVRDLRKFFQHLEKEHAYAKNTLRSCITVLRSFLRYIKREDIRAQIKVVRQSKTLPTVPTSEEVQRMIDTTSTLRDRMSIQMLARIGLRLGELCNLDVRDIDLENLRIVVRSREAWKPKGGKERVVRMDSETAALIQKHIGSRSQGRIIDVTPSTIRTMIKRAARKAGVRSAEKMAPHKLRHFFACNFLQRGGDIRSLQKLLGHSELSTTEIYLEFSFNMVSQAYNKVFGDKRARNGTDIIDRRKK